MKKKLILFLCVFLFVQNVFSQEKITKTELGKKTYQLYLAENWKELLKEGKKGLNQNIDFYYLRMRMGIAAYNLKDYRKAIKHFEKAEEEQSQNQLVKEYLYYSYLFSGRKDDAKNYSASFDEELKEKLKIKSTLRFENVYSEVSYSQNTDLSSLKFDNEREIPPRTSEQSILKNTLYSHLGTKVSLNKKSSFYLGYSFLKTENQQEFKRGDLVDRFDNRTVQNQFYFNFNYLLLKGLKITAAYHYLKINVKSRVRSSILPQYDEVETTLDNWVTSLALTKNIGKFDIGIHGTYSNLNSSKENTIGGTLAFYPFGNLNLYSSSDVTALIFENDNTDANYIFTQKIGFKVFEHLWSEVSASLGERHDYNQDNAFVVYNDANVIKNQFGLDFIFPFAKFEFSLRYKYSQEEMVISHFSSQSNSEIKDFNKHSITGGIKWNF